jgi:hypothetical protein
MADEVTVLNAKVTLDASSAKTAQGTYTDAVTAMSNEFRKASNQMQADINKLRKDEQDLSNQRKKQADEFKAQQEQAARSSKTVAQEYRSMAREVALSVGIVIGAVYTAKKAFDELEKAAQFRGLITSTRNLAYAFNVDMQSIMDALDEASNHTLTAADKFEMINKILIEGGPDVDEKLKQLVKDTREIAVAAGDEAAAFGQAKKATDEFLSVVTQIPIATGLVNGFTTAMQASSQVAIMWAAFWPAAFAGVKSALSGASLAEQITAAYEAMNATIKRLMPAVGITGGATGGEDDMRAAARRQQMEAKSLAKDIEAAEKETTDRLAKGRDKRNELIIAAGQRMKDAEQSMLSDIEALNIDHANRMAEIALDGARKREDIALDLARKIEDAETDYLQAIEDNQSETANNRIEIEQRYQERLIQIQRTFEDSYWNAVKSRDAVALVEAVRNRNRGVQDATHQRDIDMSNEDRQSAERERLAALAYQRKLEDARRYYERAMQDQQLDEQRRKQDENTNYRNRERELTTHYQQQLDTIRAGLQAQLDEANAKYGQSEADYSAHLARMAAIAASYMASLGGGSSDYYYRGEQQRQSGGADLVTSPTRFLAGEAGPELVLTVPMGGSQRSLPAPASMAHTVSGDVSHQLNMITTSGLKGMEGRIVAAVMQAMREVVRR